MLLPTPTIYLDLDGVIRDFEHGVEKRFGVSVPKSRTHQDLISFLKSKLNLSSKKLWNLMDIEFVKSLPFTPHAKDVLDLLEPYNPIILTSPSRSNATGSQLWLAKNLPKFFYEGRYIITPMKCGCANYKSILIDDWDKHTKEFEENGGFSILFPTYYNDNYQYVDMIEYYLLHRLLNIEEEMNERIRHYGIKS